MRSDITERQSTLPIMVWTTQLVFLILKLTKVITWSWWLVMLPLIIQVGLILIGFLLLGIAYYFKEGRDRY